MRTDDITYPVHTHRSAVYDEILDAEGRLVTFVRVSPRSHEIAQHIADLLNADHDPGVSA